MTYGNRNFGNNDYIKKTYRDQIPDGYRIFVNMTYVAGIKNYINAALYYAFCRAHRIEFERNALNPHDSNAIMVNGIGDGQKFFLGYVKRDVAQAIAEADVFDRLRPRLMTIFVSKDREYVEVKFQILGPKSEWKKFETIADQLLRNDEEESWR